jgi:hypothetical protein
MTEHVFRLGAVDGDLDVQPLSDWLTRNTERGGVTTQSYPPTMLEHFTVSTISRRSPFIRIFWEVTVHSDDEAFWVKMRWAEDINIYERTKRERDQQDEALRKQIENDAQGPWMKPVIVGPSRYSMGAAQSKVMIPLADPAKATAITATGRDLVRHMTHEVKKAILVEGEADFMRIFGGPSDDDISFKAMKKYMSHDLIGESDPDK